jgi:glycosyltransferase involved in cell wall biosynthesis
MTAQTADLVSVVIACHNHGRFVGEAIESALGQTGVTVEVIVVDDGSTDDTRIVVARHAAARYVHQPQSGPSVARNRGLRDAAGEFVVFLDADDRLLPGALESSLAELRSNADCAFAFGRHRYVDADGRVMSTPPRPDVDDDVYRAMLRGEDHPIHTPGVVLYRREAVAAVGGFEPLLRGTEDLDLNFRIARDRPACFNDRIVLDYRIHGANMISNPAHMLEQALAAQKRQGEYVRLHPQYLLDYRRGIDLSREYFGSRTARAIWLNVRTRNFRDARRELRVLIRHHPRGAVRYALRGCRDVARRIL